MVLEAVKNQAELLRMRDRSLGKTLLKYVPEDMIDKEVAIEAIKRNVYAIEYVPEDVIDKDVALLTAKFGGNGLEFVPKKVMDKEIAMEAVKYDGFALRYVPKDIEGYFEIAKVAIMQNPKSINVITSEYERYSELKELADKLIEEQIEQKVGHRHKK